MSDIEDEEVEFFDQEIDDEFEEEEKIPIDDEEVDEDYIDDEEDDVVKKQFELEEENNIESETIFIIPANERMTSEKLSEYEIAELINIRAVNISKGGPIYTNIDGISDPIEMAKKELIDRKCPLYIKREVGYNKNGIFVEKWSPNEMIFNIKLNF